MLPFTALLLALPWGPTARMQVSAEPAAPSSQQERQEAEKALRRILHLRSGSSLRAVARRSEQGWEYKQRGAWVGIPQAAITRVELERDVLREWKRRRAELPRGESGAEAELADWMLREGLLEEAFECLDRLLVEHPEDPGARRVLAKHARRFRVPLLDAQSPAGSAEVDSLIRWATERGPSSRELATMQLERLDERDALCERLRVQLFDSAPRRRAFAALALRRLRPGAYPKELISRAVIDASSEVRRQASFALREAREPALTIPLLRALTNSRHPRVRTQAAESLGNMGYAAAVGPLVARLASLQSGGSDSIPHANIFVGRQFAFVQDFDVEVAQFQAIADPQVNVLIEGQTTDVAVHGIEQKVFVQEKAAIRGALQKLTGQKAGNTSRDWIRWWKERGEG